MVIGYLERATLSAIFRGFTTGPELVRQVRKENRKSSPRSAAVYRALQGVESKGLVFHDLVTGSKGRDVRLYSLTDAGRDAVKA